MKLLVLLCDYYVHILIAMLLIMVCAWGCSSNPKHDHAICDNCEFVLVDQFNSFLSATGRANAQRFKYKNTERFLNAEKSFPKIDNA